MSRDKLFISHSTPNDNYQASWLASKLRLLGYDVWVDLNDLNKGATFWPKIQKAIAEDSIRFLSLVTKSYIEKANQDRSGVLNEIACACDVRDIKDFIIPLRFDDSSFSAFPIQIRSINGIDFNSNWGKGLNDLLKQLEEDKIEKQNTAYNPLDFWLESKNYHEVITDEAETYFSNWFKIRLPKYLYIHQPPFLSDDVIKQLRNQFPFKIFNNRVVTFLNEEDFNGKVKFEKTLSVEIAAFLAKYPYVHNDYITVAEPGKLLVDLLNRSFDLYAKNNSLLVYEMAHGNAYHFSSANGQATFIKLSHVGKGNKKISGKFQKVNQWQFGVSHSCFLRPFPHYKLTSHIFFSDLKGKFYDKERQHALRRSFAVNTYNRDWLDYLLAFTYKFCNYKEEVDLVYSKGENNLTLFSIPFAIQSDKGYREPTNLPDNDDDEE